MNYRRFENMLDEAREAYAPMNSHEIDWWNAVVIQLGVVRDFRAKKDASEFSVWRQEMLLFEMLAAPPSKRILFMVYQMLKRAGSDFPIPF